MRLSQIVVDLVRGDDGGLWLVNLRSYELDDDCYRVKSIEVLFIVRYMCRMP